MTKKLTEMTADEIVLFGAGELAQQAIDVANGRASGDLKAAKAALQQRCAAISATPDDFARVIAALQYSAAGMSSQDACMRAGLTFAETN